MAQRPATTTRSPASERLERAGASVPSVLLELVPLPHLGIEQVDEQLRASQRARQRQVPDGRLLQVVDELVLLRVRQPAQQLLRLGVVALAVLALPADAVVEVGQLAINLLRVEGLRLHRVAELALAVSVP